MTPLQRLRDITTGGLRKRYGSGTDFAQHALRVHKASMHTAETHQSPATFTTIDDVIVITEELLAKLNELGRRKYPLDIRRGTGTKANVTEMQEVAFSQTVKASGKTYFFDIKKPRDGTPYLVITQSRYKGAGKKRECISIVLFPEHAQEFLAVFQTMVRALCG